MSVTERRGVGVLAFVRRYWLRVYLALFAAGIFFACGVAVATLKIFPYELLQEMGLAGREWAQFPKHYLGLEPQKFLRPAPYPGNGVVRLEKERISPGPTFLTGYFDGGPGMRLIDSTGRTLHQWRVSFPAIWGDASHLRNKPRKDWDTHIHGALLYPNGDVVFNFQYSGLARIDRCSRVIWKLPRETHHSIFEDHDGNLWVPGRALRETQDPRFPYVPVPFFEEFILKVSPEGKLLQEISLFEVMRRSEYEGVMLPSGQHKIDALVPIDHDFMHPNDIEALSPQLAGAFPQWKAGDLIVSIRNLDLLLLIDPDTQKIKWSMTGPFLRQHDPDFLPSGHISVFDNRRDEQEGALLGGSRILHIDPATQAVTTVVGGTPKQRFYTQRMGDHQYLPNGNLLITESEAGRAFELAPDGSMVWAFISRFDESRISVIERATRYPENYLTARAQEDCT